MIFEIMLTTHIVSLINKKKKNGYNQVFFEVFAPIALHIHRFHNQKKIILFFSFFSKKKFYLKKIWNEKESKGNTNEMNAK